ncbi:MAG: hypothetical protein U5L09_00710 [Bacteroidales bacterium]|nr:hypothetical protein [Bacteroidales bacterium]
MQIVDKEDFARLKGKPVIVRAHGEPPETYEKARESDIQLIDATCPIVLKLQQRIAKHDPEKEQVVIFWERRSSGNSGIERTDWESRDCCGGRKGYREN